MSLAAEPDPSVFTGPRVDTRPSPALILGRALHEPWNEGTRVISRNFAYSVGLRRAMRVVSLTQTSFRSASDSDVDYGVPIEHVYTRGGYGLNGVYLGMPQMMRRLATVVAARRFGVAHLFSLPLSLAPWLSRQGTPVIVHVMVRPLHIRQRVLVEGSTRLFGRWIDAFAVSSRTLVPLLAGWGVPASKLVVLPPALDGSRFRPGDRMAARQQLGLSPDRTLIVYLGRLSPRRFPARVVRQALQQASLSTSKPIHFVALTPGETFDGSTNSGRYLLECARVVEEHLRDTPGVTVDVTLRNLDDGDKVAWLRAADAVLLPFIAAEAVEPPMTLLEAMACGAMIITSPAANRSGLIQPGVTGLVFHSPGELADMLSSVICDGARARAIGATARQVVLEQHSFEAVGAEAAGLWQRVERVPAAVRVR